MATGDLIRLMTSDDIDDIKVNFEDYESDTTVPEPESAISNIATNTSISNLFQYIKAMLKKVVTTDKVIESLNITEEGNIMGGATASEKFTDIDDSISTLNENLNYIGNVYGTALTGGTYAVGTEYTLGSVSLEAGTYLIDCNTNSKDSEITSIQLKNGTTLYGRAKNANGTFIITLETTTQIDMVVVFENDTTYPTVSSNYAWFKAVRIA